MLNWEKIISVTGLILLVLAGGRAETATNSNVGQFFKFKFELNKPLVYAMETRNTKVMDSNIGGRASLVKNSTTIRLKFKLTAVSTNQNGSTTVCYEPFDFEQDVEVNNPSGHLVSSWRGLEIVGRQNDILMVDTANGVGMADAKAMKLGVYPMLLSGYFDFDAAGNVLKFDGDLPFQDFWRESLKNSIGFFQIVFPIKSITVQDSWTNTLILKNADGVTVLGDGIVQKYVFSRATDDSSQTNGVQACFSMIESESGKNYSGYVERSGQRTSIAIPERVGGINSTFHFDLKNGRLIDMKKNDRMDDSATMMMQGNANNTHGNGRVETTVRLISP